MDKSAMPRWLTYALTLALVAAATGARWAADPWLGLHLPYTTYYVAIIAAGWIGGARAAALAAGLGFMAAVYLFVAPGAGPAGLPGELVLGAVLYLVASTLIVAIVGAMDAARRSAGQQEQLWQTTLASIGDAVVTTDTAGLVTFLNPVAERLTGWPLAEARARPLGMVLALMNERTRAPADDPVRKTLQLGHVVGLGNHTILRRRDGSELPIDDSAAPICDTGGAVTGVVVVFRDISDRRRTERERQEAQDHVISTLESIPDAFIRIDGAWRVVYVNKQYEMRFGRPRNTQLGKVVWAAWPKLEGSEAGDRFRQAMAEREIAEFEYVDDASGRCFAVKACPTEHGELAVFMGDITERRRAEEALRQSEQRFRLAGEALSGIIYDHDVATGHVERTQGLYEVLGYQPQEVPPTVQWWWAQIHPDDRARLEAPGTAQPRGRSYHEYRVRHRDGHYVYLSDRNTAVLDERGRVVRQVGCSLDITVQKEAELNLREADRRKDEFLATLAHELRNPLAPISNALHFLKARLPAEATAAWGLGVIERQVHNMARLLDDLLDVSRISRNKLVLRAERVALEAVLQQAIETSRPLIDMGGHELTVALPPEPVELDGDPLRLAQVFSNLLSNAAKYTPAGGHIRVAAAREDGKVKVSVRDDGMGIAPEMLPRLFEIFSQAQPALERAQGGLGIGLSLVRGLVELHGGSIEARSDGPGRGSEFVVRLPLPQPEAAAPAARAPETRRQAAHCRVLVADDNRDGADSLAAALETMGYEVCTAYDGEDALALAERRRPDVLLLDIGMPKRNGYDLCREVRARPWGKEVLMVALTGWGQEHDRQQAREAGFDHHLVKPVDLERLNGLLARVQMKP